MPSAKRELDEQQKFDPKLRDGIFVGYRMLTGGIWSGQYNVIDAQRFQEVKSETGYMAYDHGVNEIYIPGTAEDDHKEKLQFPVASGLWREAGSSPSSPVDTETLRTTEDEVQPSSMRSDVDSGDQAPNAGGAGVETDETANRDCDMVQQTADEIVHKDFWQIQGDTLVRVHNVPRNTMFAPWMPTEDELPVPVCHLEVSRTTKPVFAGARWPGLDTIEDAWTGHQSDAKVIQKPDDGSTSTWTGETISERILPNHLQAKNGALDC